MTDDSLDDALAAQLDVIEQQPLGERAQAYQALHDELQAALERTSEA
ncbi:MAG TPA: hypothetical protein VK015_04540 [Microbacterium sp.]|nr:hypothetical protein [Microbacterium sp.]